MPIGTIAAIVAVIILVIAVPLGTMLFLHKRGGAWTTFLIGAGTFILFAMILEQLFHGLVLFSGIGAVIQGNIWLYGLYGGRACLRRQAAFWHSGLRCAADRTGSHRLPTASDTAA